MYAAVSFCRYRAKSFDLQLDSSFQNFKQSSASWRTPWFEVLGNLAYILFASQIVKVADCRALPNIQTNRSVWML